MQASPANAELPSQRHRIPGMLLFLAIVLAVSGVAVLLATRASASRPQLDVKNTGSKPVLLQHRGDDLVIPPGAVGALRYSPGDQLTIFPGENETSTFQSFELEGRRPIHGAAVPPRLSAEVNADDPANILFRYSE